MSPAVWFCSTGLVHPSLLARVKALAAVRTAVANASRLMGRGSPRVRHVHGLHGLRRAFRSDAALVVVYLHRRRDAPILVELAERYVAAGGRVLALHAATASFRASERWTWLLGGRFVGHGPVVEQTLRRESDAGGRCEELPQRIRLRDETYRHELVGSPDVWYRRDDGEPAVWLVGGDSPRVAYFAPGHRARVWAHASVRRVLAAIIAALTAEGRTARI
ncbi:MAG: ThuA domain-containing protein [Spirochaetota bacterium]